jgi:hypothetical protein
MIKIWDRKENINGVSAIDIIARREDIRNCEEVILICNDNDNSVVEQIEFPSILKSNYNLQGITALEIGQAYLEYLNLEKEKVIQEKTEIEQLKDEMELQKQTILELSMMVSGGAV